MERFGAISTAAGRGPKAAARRRLAALGALLALASAAPSAAADPAADAAEDARIERIEDHMRALQEELATLRQGRDVSDAKVAEVEEQLSGVQKLMERVKFGGYGSLRYEANSLDAQQNTFTFRRLVFTTDAQLHDKLRFYSELEYERFRKLELERETTPTASGLQVKQTVEGSPDSEISLEQAWLQYELAPWLRIRTGAVLVPLGRFNIDHDDNRWNLTRRSLVDRGVPVLPIPAAWDELGAGLTGSFDVGESNFAYQLYVVNGATIDADFEQYAATRVGDTTLLEVEAELAPQTGTFSNDLKEAKAFTGRLAWSPEIGHELALSFYTGRYTPDYLADEQVSSLALDGITHFLGFDLEGELVTTRWSGVQDVARSFARRAFTHESALENDSLETEVEFSLANLASRKTGYWVELRRPFWPGFLPSGGFDNPQLIPVARFEQVWLRDRVVSAEFSGGTLDEFVTENRRIARGTLGLAYRPTPLVAFTAAYEYTWADKGSLLGLTNFLPANEHERDAHSFTVGVGFGF